MELLGDRGGGTYLGTSLRKPTETYAGLTLTRALQEGQIRRAGQQRANGQKSEKGQYTNGPAAPFHRC